MMVDIRSVNHSLHLVLLSLCAPSDTAGELKPVSIYIENLMEQWNQGTVMEILASMWEMSSSAYFSWPIS